MTIYCVISVVLVIQTYGDLIKTIRRQTVIVEETNCLMIHCSIDIQLFNVSILNIVEVSKHGVIRQWTIQCEQHTTSLNQIRYKTSRISGRSVNSHDLSVFRNQSAGGWQFPVVPLVVQFINALSI